MIGDVLTTSILFEKLKKHYGDCELHYVINSSTHPVVEHNPNIDKFIFFTPEIEKNYLKLAVFLNGLRKNKYDVVIDVYGKLSSQLMVLFSGAKIRIAYYKRHSSFIYSYPITRIRSSKNKSSLAIDNRMRLLEPLNIEYENISPKLYLQKRELDAARKVLESFNIDLNSPLYMISVLGSHSKKTYPARYMSQLLDDIISIKPDAQLLFNYIPNQIKKAKEIYSLCSEITRKGIYFDLYGKSLREYLALTSFCHSLIGNEGGAVNMAKALQIPTFIIFNPALNKLNWFGETESDKHVAVHLSDFIPYSEEDYQKAKKNPDSYYQKFKPTFIIPKLTEFIDRH